MVIRKTVLSIDLKRAIIDYIKFGRFLKIEILEHDSTNVNGENISAFQRITPEQHKNGEEATFLGNGKVIIDRTKEEVETNPIENILSKNEENRDVNADAKDDKFWNSWFN